MNWSMRRRRNVKIAMSVKRIHVIVMLIVKILPDHIFANARLDFLAMEN